MVHKLGAGHIHEDILNQSWEFGYGSGGLGETHSIPDTVIYRVHRQSDTAEEPLARIFQLRSLVRLEDESVLAFPEIPDGRLVIDYSTSPPLHYTKGAQGLEKHLLENESPSALESGDSGNASEGGAGDTGVQGGGSLGAREAHDDMSASQKTVVGFLVPAVIGTLCAGVFVSMRMLRKKHRL